MRRALLGDVPCGCHDHVSGTGLLSQMIERALAACFMPQKYAPTLRPPSRCTPGSPTMTIGLRPHVTDVEVVGIIRCDQMLGRLVRRPRRT